MNRQNRIAFLLDAANFGETVDFAFAVNSGCVAIVAIVD